MTMQFEINAGHMSTNKLIYSQIIYAANKRNDLHQAQTMDDELGTD